MLLESGSSTFGYHTQQYTGITGSFRYVKRKLYCDMNKQRNIIVIRGKYEFKVGHHDDRYYHKTWFLVVPSLLSVCQFVQSGGQESEGAHTKNAHAWCHTEI